MLSLKARRTLLAVLLPIGIAIIALFIFRSYFYFPSTVYGESMAPTLEDQNKILISRVGNIDRFDEVVFHAPDQDASYVKRVIGVPGDKIEYKNDVLYVNGKKHAEPYLKEMKNAMQEDALFTNNFKLRDVIGEDTIPDGYLFVMGDNRRNSKDSRMFGLIPQSTVIGEVKFRYYPFPQMGLTN
ncbi:signal peptidase I [Terribacillus saccharophilus]|uniref:Signal peptidase I n=1 Tax=Terribacillus saccharophilus TaxID=361277 RepID=A0A268HBT8_9BACI|nr:signal peptidase I [Terribacillus saccharophilus]PAD35636.1 signal peptidase I [Terribacillus saccharophilus]PAD96640.1 signal peptidase I [Terribacillus saccharophilus]PAE00216.1 signal peptidase I [Terribacillus saccharophilus]PAE07325.1 signal peptidase I [Terribacillus saccharophilus]